ncbi:hypothetical protein PPERSA_04233 [Pseudocohnilembus persalinus]|uniref:Fe2OG dioxygenase domain-containing protein n=1 Tax=Pseudocohnilembus persalinus TaxID=266149 RepID=A0A0V0QNF5_PSEPJ|nr:hypothetical protein PPERSA_04233 [Pseudocohnilembus persalinus]|eukprot:KRX03725.1 hypothetical protein PPERSA_04233 [Pseudocohnilembus persalinus]
MSKTIQRILLSGNRSKQIENLRQASQYDGCFFIGESPFSEIRETRKKVLKQLDQFYKKDLKEKQQLGNERQRGYFKIGDESGNIDLLEKKECFTFGYDNSKIPQEFQQISTLVSQNRFPEEFDFQGFQELLVKMNETSQQLVDLCSEAFEFDFNSTIDETSMYQSFMKSFRYYGRTKNDTVATTGNSLHSDWNLLTLVWADTEGLEVLRDDGKFDKVHPQNQDDLICNFGDFMASLTNGKIRSPWHRVVQPPPGKERNSLILFYYPKYDYPVQKNVIQHQGRPLGLFVDQSKSDGTLWDIDPSIENMGQMYAGKWKQVSRY